MDDDARLMQLVSQGAGDALREIVLRHQKPAFSFFLKLTGSVEDAEDLTQELFLNVHRSAARYRPDAPFRAYLFRIASNLAMSHLRKRRVRRHLSLDEMLESGVEFPSTRHADDPATVLDGREAAKRYFEALERLPSDWRVAMELRVGRDLSYDEIAEAMKKSVPAVESILLRARERIAKDLEG
jgi:RNA polymerase sigma-70 factor (ECF subfamily)